MLASVIIPTYNRADKIARAIESARGQTFPNKQIIVVDDGSTDNTAEIVAKYPDVKYFYQKNQKQAAARNAGLKFAKGDYIATLDSDDVWNE
ncbi:MAG: glycosyltransferase family 2 protein, partial [Acidobacteria bacterium]|nr:glycosyltransferase family 2 protein [Acidobacteriota bacterium]